MDYSSKKIRSKSRFALSEALTSRSDMNIIRHSASALNTQFLKSLPVRIKETSPALICSTTEFTSNLTLPFIQNNIRFICIFKGFVVGTLETEKHYLKVTGILLKILMNHQQIDLYLKVFKIMLKELTFLILLKGKKDYLKIYYIVRNVVIL